ncbi:MAG TPA: cupin domain-containing protein [Candidatus Eisenbacteria bacterium]|jgi:quercetin dioxygenase-like cupin family protein|nr:cupin domain-containing protein [Candidatus Eisenbacteria bacterium]
MKRLASFFVLTAMLCSASAFAEETRTYPGPQEGAPNVYKQVLDNDRVRVSEIKFNPGEKAAMHTHPFPHVVYVIEGGELTITHPDGTSAVMQAKPGDALWMGAETHEAVNTGTTVIRGTVTEIK